MKKFRNLKKRTAFLVETEHGIGACEYIIIARNRDEVGEFIKEKGIVSGQSCYSYSVREFGQEGGHDIWQNSVYFAK